MINRLWKAKHPFWCEIHSLNRLISSAVPSQVQIYIFDNNYYVGTVLSFVVHNGTFCNDPPSLLTRSPTVPRFRHFFNLYISLKCNINIKRNNSNSRSAGSRVCQFHTCQTFQNIQKISVGKVITKTEYLTSGECLSTLVPLLSGQVACPSSKILEISSYKVTENFQNW